MMIFELQEVQDMCNLSDGVELRGIMKGIVASIILNVMYNLKLSTYDAMIAIGVPEDEQEGYVTIIKGIIQKEMAKIMLEKKLSIDLIAEMTNLNLETIKNLEE